MGAKTCRRLGGLISVTTLVMLAFLTAAVSVGATMPLDNIVRLTIHENSTHSLTLVATYFSFLGSTAVLIPATVVLVSVFFLAGRRPAGVALGTVMGGALLLNWVLKTTIHRARPPPFYGVDPESFSFPSGHAFFALSFCGALLLILASYRKFSLVALVAGAVLVLGIAWSRVYLGVHYLTDVTAGILVGLCWLGALFVLGLFKFKSASQ